MTANLHSSALRQQRVLNVLRHEQLSTRRGVASRFVLGQRQSKVRQHALGYAPVSEANSWGKLGAI